jgi:class 3 adenylate cyclase
LRGACAALSILMLFMMWGCEKEEPKSEAKVAAAAPAVKVGKAPKAAAIEVPKAEAIKSEEKASRGEMPADRIVDAMKLGNIAFNVPRTMRLGDTEQISLLLSLDQSIEELKSELAAADAKEGAEVKVSDRMQAHLSGPPALGIVAVTPEEQVITSKGTTEWTWLITPTERGSYSMYLVLNALLTVNGKDSGRVVRSYERTIAVEVTWPQYLGGHWQWLAAAALVVPFAFWWRRRSHAETGRKLAALLCADVVGYSRLMQQDDQGTLRLLTESRALFATKVAVHGGRIVNAPGDSILAEFPSVLEALRGADDIQATLARRNTGIPEEKKMLFRIGIDVSDVLVDDAGLYGDGVNIAARLQALAEPGGICISRMVYGQVKNVPGFAFEDIGERNVKNIVEPLHVFRVRGVDRER